MKRYGAPLTEDLSYPLPENPEGEYLALDDVRALLTKILNASGEFDGMEARRLARETLVAIEDPYPENHMEIGDVVLRKDGMHLRSGAEAYDQAIVISLEPFALASIDGDMLWHATVKKDEFIALCKAPQHWYDAAIRRVRDIPTHNSSSG